MTAPDEPVVLALGDRTPHLDPTAWVAPTAAVVGAVTLGPDVSVWYGAVLRGDGDEITVGQGSNVQDGAVLHADPGAPCRLGANVTVGHGAIVHGAEVGDGSLIGMGARVLNGARIGRNCMVAAGALVPEGFTGPDGSLVVGMPAKVRRDLSDAEIADLTQNATDYAENARRHAEALRGNGGHGGRADGQDQR